MQFMGSTHPLVQFDHVQSTEFIYTQIMKQAKDLQQCKELHLEGSCICA